ncbi:polygalacturonase [Roridomyces roridus]|uniref:endo-polygalacturonase n=1 Tax=Roridomyces roridus TaxID=1738132 RepID=A0AAD7FGH4_9AGAR|nr:polygalacturonase [Roridomyces roridus]
MSSILSLLHLSSLVVVALTAFPGSRTDVVVERQAMACTVNNVASAADLSGCTSVVIEAFTVDSGETVTIAAASGASVIMTGDVTFSQTTAAGPLFTIDTDDVVFDGGGHNIDGNGALYWDGQGTDGGVAKPHPFVKLRGSGTFQNVTILNSPAQAISVGTTKGTAVISGITVDDSAGNAGGLGANTDGFDVSASDVTIANSTVNNQDDCVAINSGSAITIQGLTCIGSHGISIGSIASNKSVSDVTISGNTITGGLYGLRIKVDAIATNASVSGITYEANVVSDITEFGVLITQSYPQNDATPGTGGPISGINFTGGTTSVSVDDDAFTLVVDCGACLGLWDFSALSASGGKGSIVDADNAMISGGTF